MAFKIPPSGPVRVRKSITAADAPTTNELEEGELALNAADGVLYYQTASDTISQFPGASGFKRIVALSQAAYDALTPDSDTLYIITS
jgi:hypothetical protein